MANRRGHGSGAVYKTKSGKWEAVLDLGYVVNQEGQRRRKRVKRVRATEAAAIKALDDLKRENHLGTLGEGRSPRLADYLAQWLADNTDTRWRPNTVTGYTVATKRISDAIGHIRLKELKPAHVEAMLNGMAKTHARGTIEFTRNVLRIALNDARRNDLVIRNAAGDARTPKIVTKQSTKPNPLHPDEIPVFLTACRARLYGPLLTLAVYTGLRRGELRGLMWEDIDMEAGVLTVKHQVQDINGQWQVVPTKTDTGERSVPLPTGALAALKMQRRHQLEQQVLAGGKWKDQGFVFTNPTGDPLSGSTMGNAFRDALDAAGIPRRRFHDLRHTFASFLISHGADLIAIKELCGHASLQVTVDTYGHLFPNRKVDVMSTWDKLEGMAS